MRSCAAAGARASTVEQRNTIVRLRMMSDPIKLPVLPDRVEILPEFGAVLEPAHQVIEARDGDDGNSVALLDFPDRRQVPFASLQDRKSTRLNSSHQIISYAVFCLKKKTKLLYNYQ